MPPPPRPRLKGVHAALARAERLLPGVPAPEGTTDPRWQAILRVNDFIELDPEPIWAFITRWGSHRHANVRTAIAVTLLEGLVEHHFDAFAPRVDALARSNRWFADTLTRIWALGEAARPPRAAVLRALLTATTTRARRGSTPLARSLVPETFRERMARLRARARAGDAASWWLLATALDEGDADDRGAFGIRPDRRAAFRAYTRAAQRGYKAAWLNLGVCYDTGRGVRRNAATARRCYARAWRLTALPSAAINLGTWYRDRGQLREAVRWYRRAALFGDGEARLTLGYCLYYGLGVRRDRDAAIMCWRPLDDTAWITPYGREEAWYLRAVAHADAGRRRLAMTLVSRAAADGDYPEADALLAELTAGETPTPCRCRRHMPRPTRGQARCAQHRP